MPRDMQKKYASQAAYRARNFERVVEYLLAHPCVDCGEDDIIVLDFDHLPGSDKKFDIGRAVAGSTRSWASISNEIEKCEVVCANDHRRRTARRANYQRYAFMNKRTQID